MRFWFVHSTDVSLQQQIVTQISLGILSGELAPGERLPSIRELARRFHLHPNTVSAGYRQLERDHWVAMRRGSGVYVRNPESASTKQPNPESNPKPYPNRLTPQSLDHLIAHLLRVARAAGVEPEQLHERLRLATQAAAAPQRLLLIEPDAPLQQIVLAELAPHIHLPISAVSFPLPQTGEALHSLLAGALALVLPSKAVAVRAALPPATPLHILRIRSIPASLGPWLPAPADALVAVASHWPQFLTFAHTMLVAAGFPSDAILLCNASDPHWRHGLEQTAAVVCDTLTATLIPKTIRTIPFPLLAAESLEELARLRPRDSSPPPPL